MVSLEFIYFYCPADHLVFLKGIIIDENLLGKKVITIDLEKHVSYVVFDTLMKQSYMILLI